ncbi:MAG: hypothetical protein AAGI37_01545 [Planctomycetota bacterium]
MKQTLLNTSLAVTFLASSAAQAQSDVSMMLVPWFGDQQAQVRADAFFTPTEANITGADVDLSIFTSAGRFLLDPDASYRPTIGYEFVQYEIGSSDAALPDDLTDVSIAFGGSFGDVELGESLGGEWQIGYTLGIGYAGTTPFQDGDAWYGKADLYAVKVIDRDTRWLVGLNYDGNRVFLPDVPLPAVTYFSRLNETITYAIGLPFSQLTWRPDEFWTLDIRSAVFFSFNGTLSYQASEDLKLFASLARRSDAFTIQGGFPNRRLLFSQDRIELGLTYDLMENVALTIAGGFAFNQEFDVGFDSRDPRGLRDLDDSGYIRGGIELRF